MNQMMIMNEMISSMILEPRFEEMQITCSSNREERMAAPPYDQFGLDMDNGAEPEGKKRASDLLQATDDWRGAYADEMELALIENGNHGPQTDARVRNHHNRTPRFL